jgi:carbon-monoxide dehydrogenase medium subunit
MVYSAERRSVMKDKGEVDRMKPAPFEYHAPDSIEQALFLLHNSAGDAKLLAGGQSLVPAMNFRVVQPSVLIDLNRIPELGYIHEQNERLRIGAMTRERHLEHDLSVVKRTPLLHEAAPHIAHPQIRNRGTIGGSLVNADPAAELPVLMLASQARLKARNVAGERWIEAKDFFAGMFTTALEPDEILVEIEVPFLAPRTGWAFLEVAPRAGDYAMMGVAVLVTLDEADKCKHARLVYLNAGDGPVDATQAAGLLQGESLNDELINAAADMASKTEITPFGNIHASEEYQRHLANVLTKRALKIAVQRAAEER